MFSELGTHDLTPCHCGGRPAPFLRKMASAAAADGIAPAVKDIVVASEDTKVEVFEDDDEFEEFETEEWDDAVGDKEATQIWEDDWDDDDVSDDFSQQLRAELDRAAES